MADKNWREAKPKWVVDAAEAEMASMKRMLALRWPTETRPVAMSFRWGDYDQLKGQPIPGVYWHVNGNSFISMVEIIPDSGWRKWKFRYGAGDPSTNVPRGPLFNLEREARLYALWNLCERAAVSLEEAWAKFEACKHG